MGTAIRLGWCCLALGGSLVATAGPQHWGSGYPYVVTLEKQKGSTRLCAYEPPMRAKTHVWLRRWVDASPMLASATGQLAVGDFWPASVAKEHAALMVASKGQLSLQFLSAPERFGRLPWSSAGKAPWTFGTVRQLVPGDLLGKKRDQLVALTARGISIVEVSGQAGKPALTLLATLAFPAGMKAERMACGDFWGDKKEELALFTGKEVVFMQVEDNRLVEVRRAPSAPKPDVRVLASDFVKDGFDVLTTVDPQGALLSSVAPLKPGATKDLGPNYTGRAMSLQWMPGSGGGEFRSTMSGKLESAGTILAVSAGRVFGYVSDEPTTAIRNKNGIDDRPDAEIAFVSRFPIRSIFSGAPHYGWPSKGETFGYDVAIKNNGSKPIPAGAKLTVWLGARQPNADSSPAASTPTKTFVLPNAIPPFDPLHPQYVKVRVQGPWPYSLVPCSPMATWKKVNLDQVGERWLVCTLDAAGDRTQRNNRYEAALHAHTYHPIFRENANLANRTPTVAGDPCSLEYLSRKMADAITVVWERSATADNEDVLQRTYFDGYEVGFPDDEKVESERLAHWRRVQDKWEGWRELDIWWGENQRWEMYDWTYSAELHESGHLFHPLGDLYGNYVNPVWLRSVRLADGSPVQIQTNLWGPDLFGSGHALIGPNACELMKRFIVGSRGAGLDRWWTVAPEKIQVRVVDRDGKPVENAELKWWSDSKPGAIASGRTDAKGCWDISTYFGKLSEPDEIGVRHFYSEQNGGLMDLNAHLFTVSIGGAYVDAAICDTTTVNSHSRLTFLYQAMRDPKSYMYTIKTLYSPTAPRPDFSVVGAVKGLKASLGIDGPAGRYAVYRSWEPAYIRERILEVDAGSGAGPILLDMAEADSHGKGRFRAIYEVTRIVGERESLPRRVSICGLKNAQGLTTVQGGKLVVATNAGIANPFAVLYDGTTPAEELFYHYRFGHTARKIVQSTVDPERYYAILSSSDTRPDYRFDIALPSRERGGYDVRNDLGGFSCASFSGTSPQTIVLADAERAKLLNPGDGILIGDKTIRILAREGTTITAEEAVFEPGAQELRFEAQRLAGVPGSRAAFRELRDANSLAVFAFEGREYVAIADTGNARLAVWDEGTAYVRSYDFADGAPTSVAADPSTPGVLWVVVRTKSGAELWRMVFDQGRLEPTVHRTLEGFGADSDRLPALAIARQPGSGSTRFAVTDGVSRRVAEYELVGESLQRVGSYTRAGGVFAGDSGLARPIDAAYVEANGRLDLYVVDDGDRVLRLARP